MLYQEHLSILEEGQVISIQARQVTEKFLAAIANQLVLAWEEEAAPMFVTHTAAAVERMLQNQALQDIPDAVAQEIAPDDAECQVIRGILQNLLAPTVFIAEQYQAEVVFLAMYVRMLQKK